MIITITIAISIAITVTVAVTITITITIAITIIIIIIIKFNYCLAKLAETEGLRQIWKNSSGDQCMKELTSTYLLYHKIHEAHKNLHRNDEDFWSLHPVKIVK